MNNKGQRLGLIGRAAALAGAMLLLAEVARAVPVAFQGPDGIWKIEESSAIARKGPADSRARATIGGGGAITFEVIYLDIASATAAGFDDPVFGPLRRGTVEAALAYLVSVFDESGTCEIEFRESELDATGALARAGTFYTGLTTFDPGVAFAHITAGQDLLHDLPDIGITFDFGYNWNSSLALPHASAFDLFSVLLHEIGHGLGIASASDADGASQIFDGVYTTWNERMIDSDGIRLWDSAGDFQGTAADLIGATGGVFWGGSGAWEVFGAFPQLNTPAVFIAGSSLSHWRAGIAPVPSLAPSISPGNVRRAFQPFELAAFADLGYAIRSDAPAAAEARWVLYP